MKPRSLFGLLCRCNLHISSLIVQFRFCALTSQCDFHVKSIGTCNSLWRKYLWILSLGIFHDDLETKLSLMLLEGFWWVPREYIFLCLSAFNAWVRVKLQPHCNRPRMFQLKLVTEVPMDLSPSALKWNTCTSVWRLRITVRSLHLGVPLFGQMA